jgi:hypothetical protein
MRYVIFTMVLTFACFTIKAQLSQAKVSNIKESDRAIPIAVHDFLKTKLIKKDSVFIVTLYDTLYHAAVDTISKNSYAYKRGQAYPNIVAVDIIGWPDKFFLDTTVDLSNQKGIPSRFIELNGKLFVWWDTHYQLMDSAIQIFDKYHIIGRGGHNDWYKFMPGTDDAKKSGQYYFCRTNLSVYRKKITNIAIGGYDPPNLNCDAEQ